MKIHYFEQETPDEDDLMLIVAKAQGYVPQKCLLGGMLVLAKTREGRNPCWGCNGPREKCSGLPRKKNTSYRG